MSIQHTLSTLPPNPFLSDYLAAHVRAGVIDFHVRAEVSGGEVRFYIHPQGVSGRTEDYCSAENRPDIFNKRALDGLLATLRKKKAKSP